MDPFGNYLFLFCNRSRNRLKGLSWDRNGFVLYHKRLDGAGARFKWPKEPTDVRNITIRQLRLLMEGLLEGVGLTAASPGVVPPHNGYQF